MSDQQWLIKVNGVDEIRVDAGQTVIIGRKPLRPIAPERGTLRLDVADSTKSMSKRHARFTVSDAGEAKLEDMASTNGTYLVRDDGALMRVPANTAFPLPQSPMRFQFGDVPVDFITVPAEKPAAARTVTDLFSYAAPGTTQQQDVDASGMSVDDILDLRAGEPTGLLSTSKVRSRIGALHDRAVAEQLQQGRAGVPTFSPTDALAGTEAMGETPAFLKDDDDDNADTVADAGADTNAAAHTAAESAAATPTTSTTAGPNATDDAQPSAAAQTPSQTATPSTASTEAPNVTVQPTADATPDEQPRDLFRDAADAARREAAAQRAAAERAAAETATTGITGITGTAAVAGQSAFSPVYEAGSVFERLTSGERTQSEPSIEVDGLSSDDAKTTRDYDTQFAMAGHPQLVPFLALNPSLYDDLYAWLEAQGSADVDRALSQNKGYQEYLAGKEE